MEESIEIQACTDIICRDDQIRLLKGLIRESPCDLPSCIFLYGLAGTGKSVVLSSVFRTRDVRVCYANCIEFYSQRVVYEAILNQLTGHFPTKANDYSSFASCDNLANFVHYVKQLTSNSSHRYSFVFSHSERLRDCEASIFPALCRLQELCQRKNVCVVFCSRVPLDKFRVPTGFLEPLVVHFPQYTKDELIKILVSKRPPCCLTEESYNTYINLLLSIFYLATRNLPELKYLAELNLKSYCEPIQRGEADEGDLRSLWKNIEPKLRQALSTVYLREVSSDQFRRMQEITNTGNRKIMDAKVSTTKMELPYYSKFLLVAAYLASYNPARTDKRFFTKNHGKKRKTQAMIKAKQRSSSQLVGPKHFSLDRLLAIFYSIIEDKVAPTSHVFSQISTLVSLRLLTIVSGDDPLGTPKYKSNVSLDFIRSVARTVNFDIIQYLYDFSF